MPCYRANILSALPVPLGHSHIVVAGIEPASPIRQGAEGTACHHTFVNYTFFPLMFPVRGDSRPALPSVGKSRGEFRGLWKLRSTEPNLDENPLTGVSSFTGVPPPLGDGRPIESVLLEGRGFPTGESILALLMFFFL